jgi:CRISPR/Cas system-associated exonuclease Cas4 (RecB family)
MQLSATSIRDYLDCARRFQLRHILKQPWPAAENEPLLEHERSIQRGAQFHRLLERYYLGVDAHTLSDMITDPVVRRWWQTHQSEKPVDVTASKQILPEKKFQAALDQYTLTAFLDLVVIGYDNIATIIDWKTTRRAPDPQEWSDSIQTLVYLYIVGEKIASLQNPPISRKNIRMLYWFVEYPDQPVLISYSDVEHEQAKDKLRGLLQPLSDRLNHEKHVEWPKTSDMRKCELCVYRSLCDRGIRPKADADFEEIENWHFLDTEMDD